MPFWAAFAELDLTPAEQEGFTGWFSSAAVNFASFTPRISLFLDRNAEIWVFSRPSNRYFNYRTTRFLAEEGFYKFHNWFDDRAWYPLGRIIGGTIYPGEREGEITLGGPLTRFLDVNYHPNEVRLAPAGLMITSAAIYHVLHFFHVTIDIRNVCVFLAPLFSSFTTVVTYHLTKELKVGANRADFGSIEANLQNFTSNRGNFASIAPLIGGDRRAGLNPGWKISFKTSLKRSNCYSCDNKNVKK